MSPPGCDRSETSWRTSDPWRDWASKVIQAVNENAEKISYLHDLAKKVLDGEPGYANTKHVKYMRRRRKALTFGRMAGKAIVQYQPLKTAPKHVCWAYTCNELALKA
jgi:hypothetical protein